MVCERWVLAPRLETGRILHGLLFLHPVDPPAAREVSQSSELKPVASGACTALLWPPLTPGWSPGLRGHSASPHQDGWQLHVCCRAPAEPSVEGNLRWEAPMGTMETQRDVHHWEAEGWLQLSKATVHTGELFCAESSSSQASQVRKSLRSQLWGHEWGWRATTKVPYTVWFLCAIPYGRSHWDKNYPINKGCRVRLCNLLNNWWVIKSTTTKKLCLEEEGRARWAPPTPRGRAVSPRAPRAQVALLSCQDSASDLFEYCHTRTKNRHCHLSKSQTNNIKIPSSVTFKGSWICFFFLYIYIYRVLI